MKKGIPEFMRNANNVYRTKNFIVKQEVAVVCDSVGTNAILSRDTFYARTTVRDMEYEAYFSRRRYINGKRLPSTIYTRRYIY